MDTKVLIEVLSDPILFIKNSFMLSFVTRWLLYGFKQEDLVAVISGITITFGLTYVLIKSGVWKTIYTPKKHK